LLRDEMRVQDTGIGIPERGKCKLFSPMFTAKKEGDIRAKQFCS